MVVAKAVSEASIGVDASFFLLICWNVQVVSLFFIFSRSEATHLSFSVCVALHLWP